MANTYSAASISKAGVTLANRCTDDLILPWHAIASSRASNAAEHRMAAWLGERSQTRGALGCVGFDVADIGWEPEERTEQRRFLTTTVLQLAQLDVPWPSEYLGPMLPTARSADRIIAIAQQLAEWLSAYNLSETPNVRPHRPGISWMPARPYPPEWTQLCWRLVPVGRCERHGMWTPTPSGAAPECVFCDMERWQLRGPHA